MTRPIRVFAEARAELRAARDWYERQRAGLGKELLSAVDDVLAEVTKHPGLGALVPDTNARRGFVKRFPYAVVYRVKGDELQVLAFAHLRRRPGYWRSRARR